jgi:hypothetical protein
VTEPTIHEPGIWFGLPEETYHSDPALSSSGIRNLLVSPLDYWVNSHMNPDYVDEKTDAMVTGTAFHRRLLEPERFAQIYACAPSREDYPDAIDGHDALKAECERLGLKKSGKIADLCERILDADPRAKLWPVIRQGLMADLTGKTLLKQSAMADIERMAKIVLAHTEAAKALSGGMPEVSIFWTDTATGIRMKARLDQLKVKAIVDVKSFSNPLGKPIDSAVASAVANGRYDVQAVLYDVALAHAKAMLRKDKLRAIHHVSGPEPSADWLVSMAACEHHAFYFVFIETGPVTNVKVREFRKTETHGGLGGSVNLYWQSGMTGLQEGTARYLRCMKAFGPDKPWIEDEPARPFIDSDFPLYLFN